jgi:hypothetical protein
MGRPTIGEKSQILRHVSVGITEEAYNSLTDICKKYSTTRNKLIGELINAIIKKYGFNRNKGIIGGL